MQTLPPLSTIRVFEAAARLGSFTKAAHELGMTQAAVSYQIKVLEDRIGAPLFRRLPRHVVLTAVGESLAPAASEAMGTLRAAFGGARARAESVLSINSAPTLAMNWLTPRLWKFQLKHPKIAIILRTQDCTIDFNMEDADVGLRSGFGGWRGLEEHLLFPATFTPLASPALVKRVGGFAAPADLLKVPLLSPGDRWWREWFAAAGVENPDFGESPNINLNMQQMEGAAAVAGSGVAMLTPLFFGPDLAAGRLVRLFDLIAEDGLGHHYWLVHRQGRRSAKIRAFLDWMLEELAEDEIDDDAVHHQSVLLDSPF